MKKVNVKLFVVLVGSAAVLAVSLFLVHYLQTGRIAGALLWQANRAEEKGDLKKAAEYLRRYLEFRPNDIEKRAYLGLTLANPKLAKTDRTRERALFVLEQVVSREPGRSELRRPLARIAIELGQYDLADTHLQELEKTFRRDGEVAYLRGLWAEGKANYVRAATCYRRACALSPKKPDYLLGLADVLRLRLEKPEEAQKVVEQAVARAPDDPRVLLTAVEMLQKKDPKRAKAYVQKGRKLYPHNPSFYQMQARLEILDDRPDARRAESDRKRASAVKHLRDGLKVVPADKQSELLWTLANLLLDLDKTQEAAPEIERLRKANVRPGTVEYLEARVLVCQGHWAKAARRFERVRPRLEGASELTTQLDIFLGRCYEQIDEPVRRREAYDRAVKRDPRSVSALLGLGAAQAGVGDLESALANYRKATALPDVPDSAWPQYVRLLIQYNRQRGETAWKDVNQVLRQATKQCPNSVELTVLRGEVLAAQDKLDRARDLLTRKIAEQPNQIEYRLALINLAEGRGELDEAQRLLEQAEAQDRLRGKVELRLARARLMIDRDGVAATARLEDMARDLKQLSEEDQSRLLSGLSEAYYRIGDIKGSARLLARVAELPRHHNDLRLRLRIFDLSLRVEEDTRLPGIIDQIRRIEGNQGTWWRLGKSALLIWQARQKKSTARGPLLDEASTLLDAVAAQRPDWSAVLLSRAEIADLKGDRRQAQGYYQRAARIGGETNRWVIRQLVELGQSLAAKGEASVEAEQKLRLAVELAGQVPETWVSLVRYLAATGRKKDAEKEISKVEAQPTTVENLLALGQCYEAIREFLKAQERYEKAYKERPEYPGVARRLAEFSMSVGATARAEQVLRAVINSRPANRAAQVEFAWARRNLAVVLANGGNYRKFPEALELVGLSLDSAGKVVENSNEAFGERDELPRARARVLSSQSNRLLRGRAINYLEDLGKRRTLQPEDQYLLAQLYENAGKEGWPTAREKLRGLTATPGNNFSYLAHFARSLLLRRETGEADQDEVNEAQRCIRRLEQMEKGQNVPRGTFGSVQLKARSLELSGKPEEALALLKTYAEDKDATPDRLLIFAGCLARHNRLDEAIDQCTRSWEKGPPEMVGGATVAMLRGAKPAKLGEKQFDRLEKLFKKALNKNPSKSTSALLLCQLADLRDFKGEFDEAAKLYRQVLRDELDPENVIALNNLAWLLAQRSGKGDEALPLIQKAIELAGPRAELLDTRAVVYLAQGKSALAIADLQQASGEKPSAGRYFNLARAYRLARKAREARKAFLKAKASGLEPKRLHPVERVEYAKIADELEPK